MTTATYDQINDQIDAIQAQMNSVASKSPEWKRLRRERNRLTQLLVDSTGTCTELRASDEPRRSYATGPSRHTDLSWASRDQDADELADA
jgi:hypothetical protein